MTCLWCDDPIVEVSGCHGCQYAIESDKLCHACRHPQIGPTCPHGHFSVCWHCDRQKEREALREQLERIRERFLLEAPHQRWEGMGFAKVHVFKMLQNAIAGLDG